MRKTGWWITTLLLFIAVFPVLADAPFRAHRFDSMNNLPPHKTGDVVFLGNSITNMMEWWEALGAEPSVHNRGNSGAVTPELIENIDSLIKGDPSKIFVMIGTNDLALIKEGETTADIAGNIITLLSMIKEKQPAAEIYFQSILPANRDDRPHEKTMEINGIVENWITENNADNLEYIDLYSIFIDEAGDLAFSSTTPDSMSLSFDNLHLTQKGYAKWHRFIEDKVGLKSVLNDTLPNVWGGLKGSTGMRVTHFASFPVLASDTLLIGDEMIANGEWHELTQSANIKGRGIGWGFPGPTIQELEKAFEPIFKGNAAKGVTKEIPATVGFYAGAADIIKGNTADVIKQRYDHALDSLARLAPSSSLILFTFPEQIARNPQQKEVIEELNVYILGKAGVSGIRVIDLDNAIKNDDEPSTWFMEEGSPYLSGKGYRKVAALIRD